MTACRRLSGCVIRPLEHLQQLLSLVRRLVPHALRLHTLVLFPTLSGCTHSSCSPRSQAAHTRLVPHALRLHTLVLFPTLSGCTHSSCSPRSQAAHTRSPLSLNRPVYTFSVLFEPMHRPRVRSLGHATFVKYRGLRDPVMA
ncbi:hypothetical protein RRG08_051612 [Elysia crispata]|uniref:Uncharacterized protein n=1 Tax=Elysia crispata TaxID=231223 RepID=A0AAE1DRF5_9GAST|nr:hypothetical protein RRG08_051612 [Elysia crispata]